MDYDNEFEDTDVDAWKDVTQLPSEDVIIADPPYAPVTTVQLEAGDDPRADYFTPSYLLRTDIWNSTPGDDAHSRSFFQTCGDTTFGKPLRLDGR